MKYKLSGLVTCEVRCIVEARTLGEAIAKAHDRGMWGPPSEIGYSIRDIADAAKIDEDNAAGGYSGDSEAPPGAISAPEVLT